MILEELPKGYLTQEEVDIVIDLLLSGSTNDLDKAISTATDSREIAFNLLNREIRSDILSECDECCDCNIWSGSIDHEGRCPDCAEDYEDEDEDED